MAENNQLVGGALVGTAAGVGAGIYAGGKKVEGLVNRAAKQQAKAVDIAAKAAQEELKAVGLADNVANLENISKMTKDQYVNQQQNKAIEKMAEKTPGHKKISSWMKKITEKANADYDGVIKSAKENLTKVQDSLKLTNESVATLKGKSKSAENIATKLTDKAKGIKNKWIMGLTAAGVAAGAIVGAMIPKKSENV